MPIHVLVVNPDCLLNSTRIQIIHKHPDFSHRVRSDLDPHEIITQSYPMALADKIIPFLDAVPQTTIITASGSPKRPKSVSPIRRTRRTVHANDEHIVNLARNRSASPRKRSPTKFKVKAVDTISILPDLTTIPTPHITPHRPSTTLQSTTPATVDTTYTSRTISPGGTLFSPLDTSPTSFSIYNPHSAPQPLPTALFTPTKQPPVLRHDPRRHPSRLLATLTAQVQPIHPLLTLRHNLPTQGLRDVLEWCRASVEQGRLINLEPWLIKFRDTGRVRAILEVCVGLGLQKMRDDAEELLLKMEGGFGREQMDEVEVEMEVEVKKEAVPRCE